MTNAKLNFRVRHGTSYVVYVTTNHNKAQA